MIADWLASSGLGAVKPVLAAMVLPPASLLIVAIVGLVLARRRPRTGVSVSALACLALWACCCNGVASWVERSALAEPAALGEAQRAGLKARASAGERIGIVVLGGGVDRMAPEYGTPSLAVIPLSRLRYGVWLSRATGIPLGASGGLGWGAASGQVAEADVMAATARTEFGWPLTWVESTSRDTRENANHSVALLAAAGVKEIVVVTNGWHMPRALREFQAAAAQVATRAPSAPIAASTAAPAATTPAPSPGPTDLLAPPIRILAAPMGQAYPGDLALLDWIPSGDGAQRMRATLRELLATRIEGR
jgi:uncharacterized SAM-binding protein YcdF (DUF218 family)